MDEARRQALIARFKAGSLDRIARVRATLVELAGAGHAKTALAEVLRELHTLKGESRMLGFSELADLVHALEERIGAAGFSDRAAADSPRLVAALEDAVSYLRADAHEAPGIAERLAAHAAAVRATDDTAAPAPPASAQDPDRPVARGEARWVQVAAARVDTVCERLAELETEFRSLVAQLAAARPAPIARTTDTARGIAEQRAHRVLLEQAARCRSLLDEAGDAAWSLRLVPVEPSLRDLAVHAQELALGMGKRVEVTIHAAGAEMERSVLDELRQPLLHLVRNAIDHGVEEGRTGALHLTAEPSETGVALIVADDGHGVDADEVRQAAVARGLIGDEVALTHDQALDLLFVHGFSTRTEVSAISGRGIGLDVVRARVEALGGAVRLDSRRGHGTRVMLDVPAMIAKERALIVTVAEALFGLPSRWVREVRRLGDEVVVAVAGGRALRRPEGFIPLRSLSGVLGAPATDEQWVVVLESAGHLWAFLAAGVLGEYDLLRRPVDGFVGQCGPIAASSVLDDGRLVLLLRPGGLLRRSESAVARGPRPGRPRRRRVLVVDDSPVVRDLVTTLLEAAGLEVTAADAGDRALKLIEDGPFDLVLADIEMPGIDGLELLRLLRLRSDHLPVVMLTTRGSAEDKRRAAELGADAYLVKSEFKETVLLETVRRFIGQGAHA